MDTASSLRARSRSSTPIATSRRCARARVLVDPGRSAAPTLTARLTPRPRAVGGTSRPGRRAPRRGRRSGRVARRRRRTIRRVVSRASARRSWSRRSSITRSRSRCAGRTVSSPRSSPSRTPIAIRPATCGAGTKWVVVGRLDDARFFWDEDRKRPLASRVDDLKRVTFHKKLGSVRRQDAPSRGARGDDRRDARARPSSTPTVAVEAARMSKADLVTGLVGEFPELQGIVGGLLLRAEGARRRRRRRGRRALPSRSAPTIRFRRLRGVRRLRRRSARHDHRADRGGETPTGSRDPFGLRRAASGVFRILAERAWPLSMQDVFGWAEQDRKAYVFLQDRLQQLARRSRVHHQRDRSRSAVQSQPNGLRSVVLRRHSRPARRRRDAAGPRRLRKARRADQARRQHSRQAARGPSLAARTVPATRRRKTRALALRRARRRAQPLDSWPPRRRTTSRPSSIT